MGDVHAYVQERMLYRDQSLHSQHKTPFYPHQTLQSISLVQMLVNKEGGVLINMYIPLRQLLQIRSELKIGASACSGSLFGADNSGWDSS